MTKSIKYISSIGAFALLLGTGIACTEEEPIYVPPTFNLNEVLNIMRTTATFSGSISGDMSKIKEYGFEYSTVEEFTSSTTNKVIVGETPSSSSCVATVSGLEANERYYYRLYATTGVSKVYSEAEYFQTAASSDPLLTSFVVDSIGENLARFKCTIEDFGDEYLKEYGIEYMEKTSQVGQVYIPIPSDSIVSGSATSSPMTFFVEINGLEPATNYSFRPYAANSASADSKSTRRSVGEEISRQTESLLSADVTTSEIMDGHVGINSIQVSATFNGAAGSNDIITSCGFCWSENNTMPVITDDTLALDPVRAGEQFFATITDLKPKTLYYVRAYAINMVNGVERVGYGEVYSTTTGGLKKPELEFESEENEWGGKDPVYETTATSIHIKADILNYDANALVEKGLIWSEVNGDIELPEAKEKNTVLSMDIKTGGKTIDGTIDNLKMNTRYHVRAYAVYRADGLEEIGYSNEQSIHTNNFEAPSLDQAQVKDVTRNSATLVGGMSRKGNGTITEKGFVISKYSDTYRPELTTKGIIIVKSDDDTFTEEIKDLEYQTHYAVRTYAIATLAERVDTVYAWYTGLHTSSLNGPEFKQLKVELSSDTLSVSTGLDSEGDGKIVEKGFYWRLDTVTSEFILSNSEKVIAKGTNDDFSALITGLKYQRGYNVGSYVKSFVDGDTILYYGSSTHRYIDFNTPDVDITDVYSEANSLICSGIVRSQGDGKIVERGFLWKKYGDDIEFNLENCAHAKAEGDDEKFTYTITGLEFNTTYSVRSYVKSLAGKDTITTLQGGWWNPGTGSVRIPDFNSMEYVSNTLSSITVKSTISNPGIGTITEKGFIWIKDPADGWWKYPSFVDNPDDANDGYTGFKAVTDGTNEEFSQEITGLDKNTTYYIRAYAKMTYDGEEYISYSGTSRCSTQDYNMPNFSNMNVPSDSIGFSTAVLQTSFNSLGNLPIVKKGFVVHLSETTSEPTVGNKLYQIDVTDDEMVAKLTGLKHNTRYCVRAFATCKVGEGEETVYSGNRNFSTDRPQEPTFNNLVCANDSTTLSSLYFTCGIGEVKDGNVIEKGFIWKQRPANNYDWYYPTFEEHTDSDNYGYTGYQAVQSDSLQEYSLKITGLKPHTTYFVRSYAKVKVEDVEYVYYSGTHNVSTSILNVNLSFDATADSCTITGWVTNLPQEIEKFGICYALDTDVNTPIGDMTETVEAVKAADFEESGTFTVGVGNLKSNEEYKVGFYFILDDEEIRIDGEWWFTTKRTPSINDNVSPGKKEDE